MLVLCASQQHFSESPTQEITFLQVLNQSVAKHVSTAPAIKEDSILQAPLKKVQFFSSVFSLYAHFPFPQVMGEQLGHLSVSREL